MKYIAPSILSADFTRLGEDVLTAVEAGARYVHLDVMDGMFVPQISFGNPVIASLRPLTDAIFDVHMMADLLTRNTVATVIEEARAFHLLHHQNATALRYQFQIPRETAREIVCSCLHCPTVYNSLPMGVNPRGLKPNVLWQMDEIGRAHV